MSSMISVSIPATLILQTRMLKTIADQVVLDNKRLLSMNLTSLVIWDTIVVQFLMLLTDYLWVTTLTVGWKHRRLRVVSFDLILKLWIMLLLQRLRLVIRKWSITIRCLHILFSTWSSRLNAAWIVLLLVSIATIFNTHLFLLVYSVYVLVAIKIKLNTAIDQVLLSSLIILHLIVVDHVSEKRWFLMAAKKVALRDISVMFSLLLSLSLLLRLLGRRIWLSLVLILLIRQ